MWRFPFRQGAGRLTRDHLPSGPAETSPGTHCANWRGSIGQVAGAITRPAARTGGCQQQDVQAAGLIAGAARQVRASTWRTLNRDDLRTWIPETRGNDSGANVRHCRASLPGAHVSLSRGLVAEAAMDIFGIEEPIVCPWPCEGIILANSTGSTSERDDPARTVPNPGGLTDEEVAQRVAAGQTNKAPNPNSRSPGSIIRENTVTSFNIVIGTLWRSRSLRGHRSRIRCSAS